MDLPVEIALQRTPSDDEFIHPCPYYRFYYHLAGSDPQARCMTDCREEPLCVTGEPALGWQAADLK